MLADLLHLEGWGGAMQGAVYEQGPDWHAHVVKDGNLLTSQNPQSSTPLAEAVIAALR